MSNGIYITIEGPDGAGKTTIANKLVDYINEKYENIICIYNREPGGVEAAEKIRDILMHTELDDTTRTLLFSASRSMNIRQVIEPALQDGVIVISDRGTRSTFVYENFAKKNDDETLLQYNNRLKSFLAIENFTLNGIHNKYSTLEIVLDVSPHEAWKRTHLRDIDKTDVFESKGFEYFKKINELYKCECSIIPASVRVDANRPIEDVFNDVIRIVDNKIYASMIK